MYDMDGFRDFLALLSMDLNFFKSFRTPKSQKLFPMGRGILALMPTLEFLEFEEKGDKSIFNIIHDDDDNDHE